MEQAINSLHLVKDWAIYQVEGRNEVADRSVRDIMHLLGQADNVLKAAIDNVPAGRVFSAMKFSGELRRWAAAEARLREVQELYPAARLKHLA